VGRLINFELDSSGYIAKITAEYKGVFRILVDYGYNEAGDLTSITDAMGKTTRIRYENHLMVEKTDRNGDAFYWEYEGKGRAAKCIHTWGDKGLLEGWIAYGDGVNTVTNSLGEVTLYRYDELNLATEVLDPIGNSVEYLYNEDKELYREVYEEGNITGYTYDENGKLASKQFPDNATQLF